MHLFENIASNLIGIILLIVPGGSAATSASVMADIASSTASTTIVQAITLPEDHSFFGSFRSTLSHWKKSLDDTGEDRVSHEEKEKQESSSEEREREDESEHELRAGSTTSATSSGSARVGERTRGGSSEFEQEDEEGEEHESSERGRGKSAATVNSVPPVATTPTTPKPTGVASAITMATVAAHANQSSCYTVVSGVVYDVTSWIAQHPGGSSAITSMCGKDATAAFTGQHGGQARPASELASFKIGVLAQ